MPQTSDFLDQCLGEALGGGRECQGRFYSAFTSRLGFLRREQHLSWLVMSSIGKFMALIDSHNLSFLNFALSNVKLQHSR